MTKVLEINKLSKKYNNETVVNGISFSINEGICFGLLGPNGAGKTTTIEIIEGITPANAGEILYYGNKIDKKFKQESGIQFQSTALQEFLTVKETLMLFKNLYKNTSDLDELISLCSLGEYLDHDNQKLSGGQRQRLLLAIALINDPKIIFLDEPTTGLDPQARRNFWDLVQAIKAKNKTIVLTTHYMEEASYLCDEIIIMDKGNIIAQGTPRDLLNEHFDDTLLQIPRQDFTLDAKQHNLKISNNDEFTTIHTDNVHQTILLLEREQVSLSHLEIRSRNLDDLFIELTGKQL
ncbi:Efflux ABC transporter, ATP-binding protein [hydrothermal vent metagenome]|uniref:Efflux ABC transporter, ATP-binding protein n=1 Tax=hydrothermal vent metagenome TaxID=652676 RepID=A0A3B0ZS90_9ZZZZ